MALPTSMTLPVKFRCLCVTKATRQMITNPESTRSAIDSPIIQRMRVIVNQYRPGALQKRIHNPDTIYDLAVLQVFGKEFAAACESCTMNNERIPVRYFAQAMEVDGGKNIGNPWLNNLK